MPAGRVVPARRVPPRAVLLVVLAVVGLAAVLLAARAPASHPFRSGIVHRTLAPSSVAPRPGATPGRTRPTSSSAGATPWWVYAVLTLAALGAAVAALRILLRYRRDRPRRFRGPLLEVTVSPVAAASPPTVAAAVADALPALDDRGSVAAAVIAFWMAVGESLRRSGVESLPAETSTEFVQRVLTEVGGADGALQELSALYREARFSTHQMTQAQRVAARACAVRIRDDLAGARHG